MLISLQNLKRISKILESPDWFPPYKLQEAYMIAELIMLIIMQQRVIEELLNTIEQMELDADLDSEIIGKLLFNKEKTTNIDPLRDMLLNIE